MTKYLVIFKASLKRPNKEDHSSISEYGAQKVHIVPYEYFTDTLDELEKQLTMRGMEVTYIQTSDTEDKDKIYKDIKDILYQRDCEKLIIDITEASAYHVAVCMNLGDSDRVEVIYCRKEKKKVVQERMNEPKYIYNVVTEGQMEVLDVLGVSPMLEKEVEEECRKRGSTIATTTIYNALSDLQDLGLVLRGSGTPAEDYKSRKQKFFCLNEKQQWDYWNYRRQYMLKKAEKDRLKPKTGEDGKVYKGRRSVRKAPGN